MAEIGVGIIGTGFMGECHALAFTAVAPVFQPSLRPRLQMVADVNATAAERARERFGFARASTDWRELVADPSIEIVSITAPNILHKEMALAAIAAGKHVYCEKPLAASAAEAAEMADAAEAAGMVTQVGFNYLKNPMLALARSLIASGALGEVRTFRAVHAEDYLADAATAWSWRLDPAGGGGAMADLGSHVVATARYLLGPITAVLGEVATVIGARPHGQGGEATRAVEVEDVARAFVRFACGATGTIEASWIATGRKMQHDFEVYGSEGALVFTQERLNELRFYDTRGASGRRGFTTILAGPEHEPYGAFCVAPGHQLGFNELKAIEIRDLVTAIAGGPAVGPDFREGFEVQRVVEAVYRSARAGCRVELD
jgi:predicted dehydrogenase